MDLETRISRLHRISRRDYFKNYYEKNREKLIKRSKERYQKIKANKKTKGKNGD